jgi:SAM-dependent methyltransferase
MPTKSNKALHFPATSRNRDAIAMVLKNFLPKTGLVLEFGSGSGEHIVHFAKQFPNLTWQPSDLNPRNLESVHARVESEKNVFPNIREPLLIDAAKSDPIIRLVDAIICINVIHISPWNTTIGLMRNAERLLPYGGLLYLYGPYMSKNKHTAPTNESFDHHLRSQNKDWGVRNFEHVVGEAEKNDLKFIDKINMPANNLSIIFGK